jgi:hypothetical protein
LYVELEPDPKVDSKWEEFGIWPPIPIRYLGLGLGHPLVLAFWFSFHLIFICYFIFFKQASSSNKYFFSSVQAQRREV